VVTQGVALALAVLLAGAGVPKLLRPGHVAGALRRVFGRGRTLRAPVLRRWGRALGAWELLLAAGLVAVGGVAVAVAVAATFLGFLWFVVVAVRRGASCGCWASLTEGPAGGAELGRTGVLAAAAVWLAVAGWDTGISWAAIGWAGAVLVAMCLGAVAGGRVLPVRSDRIAHRLALRAAPTRRGRVLARLLFLLGFVHTGTNAEQDRLMTALAERQRRLREAASADRPRPPVPPTSTVVVPVSVDRERAAPPSVPPPPPSPPGRSGDRPTPQNASA
jgi:hypothetical protein